eukprot:COSAG05_NODE_1067_length_5971_cov_450.254257_7_plen_68_part_00
MGHPRGILNLHASPQAHKKEMKKDMLKDRLVGLRESHFRKGFLRLKEASGTDDVPSPSITATMLFTL